MSTPHISPTAHYTGAVWYAHGLSYEELRTSQGEFYLHALRLLNPLLEWNYGVSLENMLLQRHLLLNYLLERAIQEKQIAQVVEVASGFSPRGLRFAERFDHIVYIDSDLSGIIELKKDKLKNRRKPPNYVMEEVDVLLDIGNDSLFGQIWNKLDREKPTAVLSEGLISYFNRKTAITLLRRIARFLENFPLGIYLTDVHPQDLNENTLLGPIFRELLGLFVQQKLVLPFYSQADLVGNLLSGGFADIKVYHPHECTYVPAMPYSDNSPVIVVECLIF
ncbi:MAG: class I SAM-dependent methyltransferase [Leptospiraceae bacterium]|nr:class I SAM-dependent methyltransferase [Leptospiraceae bacterium]MDW8305825.1 class I SAM-dependent methyltransferase [Leptospiraceae bacterium]